MSRPKGSKNKKTLLSEAQLGSQITAQRALKNKLKSEEQKLEAQMEALKDQIKAKKKELRSAERKLAALIERKSQADAAAAAQAANAAQKQEVEKVLSALVNSGKSANEILELLKK